MKATKEFIAKIPASAVLYYSNRVDASLSYSSTWGECAIDIEFCDQFIGAEVTESVDDGTFDDTALRATASGKSIYSMVIEEGEHVDAEGACAAERLQVMWAV